MLGAEAMKKMSGSDILIVGVGGLGVEIGMVMMVVVHRFVVIASKERYSRWC